MAAFGGLSALGLHQRAHGSFSKVTAAGHDFTTGRFSALGLHQPASFTSVAADINVLPAGAQIQAVSGNVGTNLDTGKRSISPLALATPN